LTGRYCWRTRLKRSVMFGYEPPLIEEGRMTVASLLKDVGYHTAAIGKWHVGLGYSTKPDKHIDFDAPLPWPEATREEEESIDFTQPLTGGPTELGFDYFYGTSGCSTAQPPYGFIENDRFVDPPSIYRAERKWKSRRPGMTSPGWDDSEPDPIFAEKAVQYIEERATAEQPFFLYLCPTSPHDPCVDELVPEFARNTSEAGPRGDMVWLFDWVVGEVMDALDRTGATDNTLIMVTSDNGALPGDLMSEPRVPDAMVDGEVEAPWVMETERVNLSFNLYGHKSCGDWRGYKGFVYEGGHREPLIARWPGKTKPDTVCDDLVGLTDLLATCAAINDVSLTNVSLTNVSLTKDTPEDSVNILPLLLGEQVEEPIRPDLIHHSGAGYFSVRQGPWKCVFDTKGHGWFSSPPVPGSPGQLFNIEDDPTEQHDLWDERPDIVSSLKQLLEHHQHET
ncbi:MAG TPA: hypothetical protein DCM54_04985, partial [Gammaproteobacteria bacterium]|nr:hypothetical protein [Gammaproteobacteria bacterium]